MGYGTKNRGKNKEIAHSTSLSRSMGEGIREEMKHIFINSSQSQGRGNSSTFENFFSPKFETKYFIFDETYMFRIKTEHISERVVVSLRNFVGS